MPIRSISLEDRVLKMAYRIEEESGCWIPPLKPDPGHGYTRIGIQGKLILTHRAFYEVHVGPIPEGLVIDHLCRNRACCNPAHLEAVTFSENALRGESPCAKFARRKVCSKGHPLEGENLANTPSEPWRRRCKICALAAGKKSYHKCKNTKYEQGGSLCKKGHVYTDADTRFDAKRGKFVRLCRICEKESSHQRYLRRKTSSKERKK